ncbi:MAG: hypothetical protein AB6733_07295, partial [Clostridiaceae bacterium]
MREYPWYDIVGASEVLMQGDFVSSCPVMVPSPFAREGRISAEIIEYDVVIMSQSCDLAHHKLDNVLVSPVWPISEMGLENEFFRSRKGKESLRQGNLPGYH